MSSSGFNPGGGGSSEYYPGRPINTIHNLITTTPSLSINNLNHPSLYRTQHHLQQQHHQQQPLPPIFLDPSSQIPQHRIVGKRTLAEFQTQQNQTYNHNLNLNNNNNLNMNNNNHNHVLSNLLLRSVKPRTGFQFHNNNPLSFSVPELQSPSSFNNNFQTPRLGVPLLHQLRPQPQPQPQHQPQPINPNFHYRNSNLSQVVNRVQTTPEPEKKLNEDQKILQELEKQLLEDDDECEEGDASVITTSEWTETYQNLLSGPGGPDGLLCGPIPAQKPSSSSPTTSTTSSTSTAASSHASVCSKQTLIEAASAISEGKNEIALEILTLRLGFNSNPNGNSDQRLTNCMASALKSRINPVENHSHVVELFGREHAESIQLFLENSVCFKVSYMAANLAILESAFEENGRGFCVVDFEIGQGKQYVNLLHALKARDITLAPGFMVKLIAVVDNGGDEMVKAVGEMLTRQAEMFRIGFEFRLVSVSQRQVTELSRELLGCDSEEILVVNFAFKLNRIPDESVSTENPRDELLRRVKKLSPRVVTVVEQEMNCNTAPFLARVAESWSYYSALYDSVETVIGKDNPDRVRIEEGLSRKISNSVACEGRDRVERFEVFGKWRARMSMAGFMLIPMSQNVAESIKSRLAGGSNHRVNTALTVKEENGGICFGWMGRTLTVASAWR
ncbi:scarecrow-like protein 8 [Vicia villosa]|uniref:scarecrow-like protein 8 n=1 Tax=Vicia villosa TaxID=3911 RepID=UPI00273A79B2|nr:scarecrow-like protein 8 [Vicia villosa]